MFIFLSENEYNYDKGQEAHARGRDLYDMVMTRDIKDVKTFNGSLLLHVFSSFLDCRISIR